MQLQKPDAYPQKYLSVLSSRLVLKLQRVNVTYIEIPVTNNVIKTFIGKEILVNCKKGKHRSASVIYSYLVHEKRMTLDQAVRFLKNLNSDVFTSSTYMLDFLKLTCT